MSKLTPETLRQDAATQRLQAHEIGELRARLSASGPPGEEGT